MRLSGQSLNNTEFSMRNTVQATTSVRPAAELKRRQAINYRVNNAFLRAGRGHVPNPSMPSRAATCTHVHAPAGGTLEGASPGQQGLGRIAGEAAAGAVAHAGGHHGAVVHLGGGGAARLPPALAWGTNTNNE